MYNGQLFFRSNTQSRVFCALISLSCLFVLAACGEEDSTINAPARPVRTQVVEITKWSRTGMTIGEIKPRYEYDLSFRIAGKISARLVDVGSIVKKNTVIARLDKTNEEIALRIAEANVRAVTAERDQARQHESRQRQLLQRGITTQANYDVAERRLKQAEAKLESAELARKDADDRLGYTELRSDFDGIVTAVGAQPGQVVGAGQMIGRVARTDAKEAEFRVSERTLRSVPENIVVQVHLLGNPSIKAVGNVREVGTTADPVTRTYAVRVALNNAPEAMRFGATVQGRVTLEAEEVIRLPASALFRSRTGPAVWVYDPDKSTVNLRPVMLLQYEKNEFLVIKGLVNGERVVTAGVQKLWPGMRVRLP